MLLVFLASRDMNENEESLLMSVCAAISDNAIGKEFERLALKNRNFGLILLTIHFKKVLTLLLWEIKKAVKILIVFFFFFQKNFL